MLNELLKRYPALWECKEEILNAEKAIISCYEKKGKLLKNVSVLAGAFAAVLLL